MVFAIAKPGGMEQHVKTDAQWVTMAISAHRDVDVKMGDHVTMLTGNVHVLLVGWESSARKDATRELMVSNVRVYARAQMAPNVIGKQVCVHAQLDGMVHDAMIDVPKEGTEMGAPRHVLARMEDIVIISVVVFASQDGKGNDARRHAVREHTGKIVNRSASVNMPIDVILYKVVFVRQVGMVHTATHDVKRVTSDRNAVNVATAKMAVSATTCSAAYARLDGVEETVHQPVLQDSLVQVAPRNANAHVTEPAMPY